MRNLAEDPAYASTREALWQTLEAALHATGDPRIEGKGAFFDTTEYVGDAPHSWARYLDGTWQPQQY